MDCEKVIIKGHKLISRFSTRMLRTINSKGNIKLDYLSLLRHLIESQKDIISEAEAEIKVKQLLTEV